MVKSQKLVLWIVILLSIFVYSLCTLSFASQIAATRKSSECGLVFQDSPGSSEKTGELTPAKVYRFAKTKLPKDPVELLDPKKEFKTKEARMLWSSFFEENSPYRGGDQLLQFFEKETENKSTEVLHDFTEHPLVKKLIDTGTNLLLRDVKYPIFRTLKQGYIRDNCIAPFMRKVIR